MRFAHYYPAAAGEHSGVIEAMAQWVRALIDAGQQVAVVHAGGSQAGDRFGSAELRHVHHIGAGRATQIPVNLGAALRDIDLLVLHEGWFSANHAAALAAHRAGVPYVVIPHGVYEPVWIRTLKPPRRPRQHIEAAVLKHAAAVHVFFAREAQHVQLIAPGQACITAPTGCSLPDDKWEPGGDYLAWFGRYSVEHKGLDLLLRALAAVPAANRPLLRMRGVDFAGGFDRITSLIRELGLEEHVDAGGPIWGSDKRTFLIGSAGYVHPSRWDCHPGALAEALSLGVPCAVADSVYPAQELASAQAALLTGLGAAELADTLIALTERGPELAGRGRAYVADQLAWPQVISDYLRQLEVVAGVRVA